MPQIHLVVLTEQNTVHVSTLQGLNTDTKSLTSDGLVQTCGDACSGFNYKFGYVVFLLVL
jgi:hypothetical protein